MIRSCSLTACAMLACVTLASASHAATIAYDNATTTATLQRFGNALGMDFNVSQAISVSSLGAFDNGVTGNLNGVDGTSGVTVAIFDRTTGTQVGPSVTFTSATPGTQTNGDAFSAVTPFVLAAGFQGSIVAFNDPNYNSGGAANTTSTLNGGGALSFVGGGRFGLGNVYPTNIDTGPNNRYDAGTFQFSVAAVPEPGSIALLVGMSMTGAGFLVRRKSRNA